MQDDKRAESYEKIMQYQRGLHEKNQMRIKTGIKLVIIIPLIFLIVMFRLDSSKVIFLILWIVSLFGISAYLISVEYMDYQVQLKLNEWGISEGEEIRNLLTDDSKMEQIIRSSGILEALPQFEIVQDNSAKNDSVQESVTQSEYMELDRAEEELVQSIRKYVHALSVQTVQQNAMQVKSPQDYVQMRRERVRAHALEKKDSDQTGVGRNED